MTKTFFAKAAAFAFFAKAAAFAFAVALFTPIAMAALNQAAQIVA